MNLRAGVPIKERIRNAFARLEPVRPGHGSESPRSYDDMLRAVFPEKEYPRAWRYSSNGGPPGCAMAFGRAVREMGGSFTSTRGHRLVNIPGTKTHITDSCAAEIKARACTRPEEVCQ